MPPPTNTSLATAIDVGALPASVTQNVHDAGTTYTVWYTVTVPAGVTVIGAFAFGDLTVYRPTLEAPYTASEILPSDGSVTAENRPVQFAVTAGAQVWLKIVPNSGHPTPASLTLAIEAAPSEAVPVGAIVVPDDEPGRPAAFVDAMTGAVLRFVSPFPAGEQGDVLANGTILVSDEFTDLDLKLYDATFTRLTDVAWTWTSAPTCRANHGSNRFTVGSSGLGATPARVSTVSAAGVLGATTWVLPLAGLTAAAASNDDTVLYFSGQGGSGNSQIQRWNLTTDSAMTDLVAAVAGSRVTDILVLGDDSLVVSYFEISAPQDLLARHYSAAGALLHTYSFGSDQHSTTPRLAYALDDPLSFWIWTHPNTLALSGFSRIFNVRISDGVLLTTLTVPEYESGVYEPAESETPAARFGISFSCPFFLTRVAREDEDGPPYVAPSTHLDARYIRRLRRAPHVANDNTRVFVRRFELDLERGQGVASGQGSDPVVLLRLSRDGGQTWGEEIRMHAGALGAYTQRCLARRLGQARDTVFEVTVSDPIAWSLVGAWLDLEPGAH